MEPNGWTVFFASFAGTSIAFIVFALASLLAKEKKERGVKHEA